MQRGRRWMELLVMRAEDSSQICNLRKSCYNIDLNTYNRYHMVPHCH